MLLFSIMDWLPYTCLEGLPYIWQQTKDMLKLLTYSWKTLRKKTLTSAKKISGVNLLLIWPNPRDIKALFKQLNYGNPGYQFQLRQVPSQDQEKNCQTLCMTLFWRKNKQNFSILSSQFTILGLDSAMRNLYHLTNDKDQRSVKKPEKWIFLCWLNDFHKSSYLICKG